MILQLKIKINNDFNDMNSISNINSLFQNNYFEINNISSINSTKDKQPIDKYESIDPFLKQETISNLPKKQKFSIYIK